MEEKKVLILDLWGISLLLAVLSIILLFVSEMLSPHYGMVNSPISAGKLRKIAIVASILFMVTVALKAVSIILQ